MFDKGISKSGTMNKTTLRTDRNEVSEGEPPPIECRDLWKIYGEKAEAALAAVKEEGLSKEFVKDKFGCIVGVAGASFSVQRGEIFCIMGLSGSGKSTLIRHINQLIRPTSGDVLINGISIGGMDKNELRRLRSEKIGMVFQNMALLPYRTVCDNVAFGLEIRKVDKATRIHAAKRALGEMQLAEWCNHFPDELSGGMQQRVGLARALAADPEILLMDEPFSALDPLIRRQLQKQFLDLSNRLKKTTLFITHDLDEAIHLGNHIGIMKDGVLVQVGTPEEIVTQPADEYVADFVAGISRLHLVYAHSVMYPVELFRAANPTDDFEKMKTVHPDYDLDQVAEIMLDDLDGKLAVIDDGKIVGIVTRRSLLNGLQGKSIDDLQPR